MLPDQLPVIPVSVIIPSFNSAAFLRECVASINAGTAPAEIIIVDDHSDDDSILVAQGLAREHANVRLLAREQNGGAAAARYDGLVAASHEWVSFIDADDFVEPDAIRSAYLKVLDDASDLCIFDLWRYDAGRSWPALQLVEADFPKSGRQAVIDTLGSWKIHPLGVAKKQLYLSTYANFNETCLNADELLTRLLFAEVETVSFCKKKYFYRVNAASSTQSVSPRRLTMLDSHIWLARFARAYPEVHPEDIGRNGIHAAWMYWKQRRSYPDGMVLAALSRFLPEFLAVAQLSKWWWRFPRYLVALGMLCAVVRFKGGALDQASGRPDGEARDQHTVEQIVEASVEGNNKEAQKDTDKDKDSYGRILRSTSIIGGASIANILVGLVRMKVASVLLGPAGIGLIGLLQNLLTTAATVSALGFGTVGTRQIAEAVGREDTQRVAEARRALFWGTLALALAGGILVWVLSDVLAANVMRDASLGPAIGWLGLAVALAVAAGSQAALLNGLRRIGDLARVNVASAVISSALGVAALLLWGERGVVAFVVAAPLASFLVGHWYVAKLPPVGGAPTPLRVLTAQWKTLARLGSVFMLTGVVASAGHLVVRMLVKRDLGDQALGLFQASWTIAMTYIAFVLGAMGADFFPRLVATINDHATANRVVNEQTEVALLLAAPVLLGMLALAPWVVQLLYSREFTEAALTLRWMVIADVLKVVSWPLSFIILAAGGGRTYMLTEVLATGVFVGLVWVGLPLVGLPAAGLAVNGMYLLHLPLVYWLARRRTGFSWVPNVRRQALLLLIAALAIFFIGRGSDVRTAIVGLPIAMAFGLFSLTRLAGMSTDARVTRVAALGQSALVKLGLWRG